MTDAPITNQDLQMTLAQIEETLAQSADPQLAVEGIGTRLGDLFADAEARGDTVAQHAIQSTWNNVQQLADAARHHKQAALTMADLAGTFQNQRDNALKELEDLTDAVENRDLNHPDIAAIYEEATDEGYQTGYEMASQDAAESTDEYVYDTAYEIIDDKYGEAFGYGEDARLRKSIFTDVLWGNIELTNARKAEFFAWLDAVKADEMGDDDE